MRDDELLKKLANTRITGVEYSNWFNKIIYPLLVLISIGTNLTLAQILKMVFYWSQDLSIKSVGDLTGYSNHTVVDWYSFCLNIYGYKFENRQPMGGINKVLKSVSWFLEEDKSVTRVACY